MKKTVVALISLPLIAFAAGEQILELNLAGTSPAEKWSISKNARHPQASATLKKEKDGTPYLALRNHMHYHAKELYPVTPGDTIEIKLKVRGSGPFYAYYYVYDGNEDWCNQALYRNQFKQHVASFTEWSNITIKIPVVNPVVNEKQKYATKIRPLLEIPGGVDLDLARFDVTVHRAAVIRDWKIEQAKSGGTLRATSDGIIANGPLMFHSGKCCDAKAGSKFTLTLKVKGKGSLTAGCYLFDSKYKPNTKSAAAISELTKEQKIDSGTFQQIKFSFEIQNIQKNGQKFYITKIDPLFRLIPAPGASMEIAEISMQAAKDESVIPEF